MAERGQASDVLVGHTGAVGGFPVHGAGCGIVGVRTASRGLLLVEELRADVEATPDDEARESLRAFLAGVLQRRPTRQLAVRVRVLGVLGSWSAPAGLGTPLRALAMSVLGFSLPILGISVLVWSGVLDVAPDL